MRRALLPSLAVLLLTSCFMQGDHEQMSSAVQEARAEAQRHEGLCQDAATSAAVSDELARHENVMGDLFERMDGAMGDMPAKHSSGGMKQDVASMKAAMAAHHERLLEADSVNAAHAECASYGAEMTGLCANAQERIDGMDCM